MCEEGTHKQGLCLIQDKPLGHPNCLKGKTFVITGTLDSLYRGEAEDYIKRHSGRVTGSVSGKTDFLLVGENSGNSKVNQVKHHPAQRGGRELGGNGVWQQLVVNSKPVLHGSDQHGGFGRDDTTYAASLDSFLVGTLCRTCMSFCTALQSARKHQRTFS